MINAVDTTFFQQNSGQRAHDALSHGPQIMTDAGDIGSIVGVGHDPSVANDRKTVLFVGADSLYQPSQAR